MPWTEVLRGDRDRPVSVPHFHSTACRYFPDYSRWEVVWYRLCGWRRDGGVSSNSRRCRVNNNILWQERSAKKTPQRKHKHRMRAFMFDNQLSIINVARVFTDVTCSHRSTRAMCYNSCDHWFKEVI